MICVLVSGRGVHSPARLPSDLQGEAFCLFFLRKITLLFSCRCCLWSSGGAGARQNVCASLVHMLNGECSLWDEAGRIIY